MASILFLGFFIGMHHTLEADHVAAVASISSDENSVRRIVKHGVVWGMGHTMTLLVFGGGAVMLGADMPETLAHGLETAVGVMLIFLGGHPDTKGLLVGDQVVISSKLTFSRIGIIGTENL